MQYLRQSTSIALPLGPFIDSTDGFTPEMALTITQGDIRLRKNGVAWAQKNAAQTLSHTENGNYEVTLDATDTNTLGPLRVHVAEAGAGPVWEDYFVITQAAYDALAVSWPGTEIVAIKTVVDAVKVQTDKLTFTVANVVDANVQRQNDVPILGDGSSSPFHV